MVNSQIYCQNCGHESHCGEKCLQNYGEKEKTVCCTHCRCKKDDDSWEDQVKYDLNNEDLFNGA
jgi:hypothetical protein